MTGPAKPARIDLLSLYPLDEARRRQVEAAGFRVHAAHDAALRSAAVAQVGGQVRAVMTTGFIGFDAAQMAELPMLEIVAALGAGFERIDLAAARARGIVVTHGRGANADSVADHAMALLLGAVRGIREADIAVRAGRWNAHRGWPPAISGRRLGLIGFGQIGSRIAARAADGFAMSVGYHARNRVTDSRFRFFGDAVELAAWADFLVAAVPGGTGTRHMVGEALLGALGSSGYLVNVGRGSVVDNDALAAALRTGVIAGAALDVVEGEPEIPPALLALPNIVFTPHLGGRSPQAREQMLQLALDNLVAHFEHRPVPTPVPGPA